MSESLTDAELRYLEKGLILEVLHREVLPAAAEEIRRLRGELAARDRKIKPLEKALKDGRSLVGLLSYGEPLIPEAKTWFEQLKALSTEAKT